MVRHILMLEDEDLVRKSVATLLYKHYGNSVCVHGADSYYQAEQIADKYDIDAFILDIELGIEPRNGIDFAEGLRAGEKYKKAGIIFTTADESAWRIGINELRCYGYITKPYRAKELLDALDSLFEGSEAKHSTAALLTDKEKSLVISTDQKNFHLDSSMYRISLTGTGKSALRIKLSDIVYLESKQRKTLIYTINENEEYTETKFLPLSKFMEDMENTYDKGGYFYRCKSCYIVNTNYCRYYDPDAQSLILAHGNKKFAVHVARNLQAEAKRLFGVSEQKDF
ncbi:MAG: LytTR family DNA-binding domain-containing protein [Oscillospiraceae bacterium]|nr:LytTR family DNA-binding domain-containing protein [Oscillospiraceae bacterium]